MQINYVKATRWWKMRDKVSEYGGTNPKSIPAVVTSVWKSFNIKAVAGRGRRWSDWVSYLYAQLLSRFMRLKAAEVKFSPVLIGLLACTVMNDAPLYSSNFIDPFDDKPIVDKIETRWVQQSCYGVYLHLYIYNFYWLNLFAAIGGAWHSPPGTYRESYGQCREAGPYQENGCVEYGRVTPGFRVRRPEWGPSFYYGPNSFRDQLRHRP